MCRSFTSIQRYLLWRAWRRELERVSIYTKDIARALTAHHICTQPERWEAERTTFCQKDCGRAHANRVSKQCSAVPILQEGPVGRRAARRARNQPRPAQRELFQGGDGPSVLRDCAGRLPSTPKITEFVAVGAAGGCLPVVVVPSPVRDGARRQLPYASTWLDYCEIAFIVPESAVGNSTEMRLVLDRLNAVTEEAAEVKRAALRRVRDAFVARTGAILAAERRAA